MFTVGQKVRLTAEYQAGLKKVGYWCGRDNEVMIVSTLYTPRIIATEYADKSRRIIHVDNLELVKEI